MAQAEAAWIWSSETRRWLNPKYAAKDSPQSQMEWAMTFYEKKDYTEAAKQFSRLVRTYPRSELAPEAQYLTGVSYEMMDRPGLAFKAYKQVVEVYPFSDQFKDAVEREFMLAGAFSGGKKLSILGPLKMPSKEKAVEIYLHVVNHAPYGSFGDKAQFQLGEVFLTMNRLEEAQRAFQEVVDDYPASELVEQAKFKIAECAHGLSLEPSYDQSSTDDAIGFYETFVETHPQSDLATDAEESLVRLEEIKAQGLLKTAQFYDMRRKPKAAAIYYQDILSRYPKTPSAVQALAKLTELEESGVLEK